jgi:hypothetical protein
LSISGAEGFQIEAVERSKWGRGAGGGAKGRLAGRPLQVPAIPGFSTIPHGGAP